MADAWSTPDIMAGTTLVPSTDGPRAVGSAAFYVQELMFLSAGLSHVTCRGTPPFRMRPVPVRVPHPSSTKEWRLNTVSSSTV